MKAIHYAMSVTGALAANLAMLFGAFPPAADPFIKAGIATCSLATVVLGIVSKSALPEPSATPAPAPKVTP